MDNLSKAIIMAGEVLMFLVAISVGIYLYQTLMNAQDSILISSENYSREAEHTAIDVDTARTITGEEVICTLIGMIEEPNSYEATTVEVNGGQTHSVEPPSDGSKTIADMRNEKRQTVAADLKNYIGKPYTDRIVSYSSGDGKYATVKFN